MCHFESLAGGPSVSVHGCQCGLIHVASQGLTIHLTEAGLREISRVLNLAVASLDFRRSALESLDIRFLSEEGE